VSRYLTRPRRVWNNQQLCCIAQRSSSLQIRFNNLLDGTQKEGDLLAILAEQKNQGKNEQLLSREVNGLFVGVNICSALSKLVMVSTDGITNRLEYKKFQVALPAR
jgi:hypothetical protein